MDKYTQEAMLQTDDDLLETRNLYKVLSKLFIVCACVFTPFGILPIMLEFMYGQDGILFLVGLFIFGTAIMCWALYSYSKKKVHAADLELARRGLTQHVNQSYKQTSSQFKKVIIVFFAVLTLVMIAYACSQIFESSDSESGSGIKCPSCGVAYRENHSAGSFIKEFGVCSNCHRR